MASEGSVEAGFDLHELDELTKLLYQTAEKKYPDLAKKFLREQGNKGKRIMRSEIRSRIKGHRKRTTEMEKSTSLLRGVSQGKVYQYDKDFQIRVYNKAFHAYLVEHGHENEKKRSGHSSIPVGTPIVMIPKKKTTGHVGPLFVGRDGTVKKIEGRYYAANTTKRLKAEFPREVEAFVDGLIKEGLEL